MRKYLFCFAVVVTLSLGLPAFAVSIDWVTVGDPGNACDVQSQGCFGSVDYTYSISKFEITNVQYLEFLNAVAASDPNGLYAGRVAADPIFRQGEDGSYSYILRNSNDTHEPVAYVNFYDALRFANWMHNGQPTGAQDASTTEDGAYTITAAGVATNTITRNPGATIALTSEDEWYKAAYYDTILAVYYDYPGGDLETICAAPSSETNSANCGGAVGRTVDVGSYPDSPSAVGAFDLGGNVNEWTEAVVNDENRVARGGGYFFDPEWTGASNRLIFFDPEETDGGNLGFRLVFVPEPATGTLLALGLAAVGWHRRR